MVICLVELIRYVKLCAYTTHNEQLPYNQNKQPWIKIMTPRYTALFSHVCVYTPALWSVVYTLELQAFFRDSLYLCQSHGGTETYRNTLTFLLPEGNTRRNMKQERGTTPHHTSTLHPVIALGRWAGFFLEHASMLSVSILVNLKFLLSNVQRTLSLAKRLR